MKKTFEQLFPLMAFGQTQPFVSISKFGFLPHLKMTCNLESRKFRFKSSHIHISELLSAIFILKRGEELGFDLIVVKDNVDFVYPLTNKKSETMRRGGEKERSTFSPLFKHGDLSVLETIQLKPSLVI
jgi:hypothetical protein